MNAVAKALGRNAIGVDLSRDYLRLAEWRVNDGTPRTIPKDRDLLPVLDTPVWQAADVPPKAVIEQLRLEGAA